MPDIDGAAEIEQVACRFTTLKIAGHDDEDPGRLFEQGWGVTFHERIFSQDGSK
jgi:hypothetical protein